MSETNVSTVTDAKEVVFVTKHALTAGVIKVRGYQSSQTPSLFVADSCLLQHDYYHGEHNDWHRTWKSALERAEHMRTAKIKSLEKQIEKLKALKFDEPAKPVEHA